LARRCVFIVVSRYASATLTVNATASGVKPLENNAVVSASVLRDSQLLIALQWVSSYQGSDMILRPSKHVEICAWAVISCKKQHFPHPVRLDAMLNPQSTVVTKGK
jgi:hypothetical protein